MGALLPPNNATTTTTVAAATQNPSWVDEFLDFSSARRGAHRHSASDSIAFFEVDDDDEEEPHHHHYHHLTINNSCNPMNLGAAAAFDRLDEEQLLSMFTDDVSTLSSSSSLPNISSTPSDQNGNNEDKPMSLDQQQLQKPKPEPGEAEESSSNVESQQAPTVNTADPKRVKRYINR